MHSGNRKLPVLCAAIGLAVIAPLVASGVRTDVAMLVMPHPTAPMGRAIPRARDVPAAPMRRVLSCENVAGRDDRPRGMQLSERQGGHGR